MSRPLLPSEPTTALEGCLGRAGLKSLPAAEGAIIDPRVGIFYRCMYQETKGELARANRNASSTRLAEARMSAADDAMLVLGGCSYCSCGKPIRYLLMFCGPCRQAALTRIRDDRLRRQSECRP